MKPPRRPQPPTLATVIGEALVLVAELHPDHWPSWLKTAALGDPWSAGSTNTLRLALAHDVAPKRGRGPACAADLAELRSAIREVSR